MRVGKWRRMAKGSKAKGEELKGRYHGSKAMQQQVGNKIGNMDRSNVIANMHRDGWMGMRSVSRGLRHVWAFYFS